MTLALQDCGSACRTPAPIIEWTLLRHVLHQVGYFPCSECVVLVGLTIVVLLHIKYYSCLGVESLPGYMLTFVL